MFRTSPIPRHGSGAFGRFGGVIPVWSPGKNCPCGLCCKYVPLPPFWIANKKQACKKTRAEMATTQEELGAQHGTKCAQIHRLPTLYGGHTSLRVHVQIEVGCVTWANYSCQAAPWRGQSCPGQKRPDSRSRKRGTMSLRTLVSPSARFSASGSQYAFSRSPSPRARSAYRILIDDHLLCPEVSK